MTTRVDEDPEFAPDDPLAVILRPAADRLAPPSGSYETIRRTAARRRLLRAASGAGLVCAVAALIAVPLTLTAAPDAPSRPTVPLAPPVVSDTPAPTPTPRPTSEPTAEKTPSPAQTPSRPSQPADPARPDDDVSRIPSTAVASPPRSTHQTTPSEHATVVPTPRTPTAR
ncbi:hypothetical protein ACIQAC_14410 [Streptomyces sp. NPDC088387]|uniref:hypothetical protein n=1 Tax=Streptomyces sp. NPDC088387 TaxID=3365859 RepID=UPI0038139CB5